VNRDEVGTELMLREKIGDIMKICKKEINRGLHLLYNGKGGTDGNAPSKWQSQVGKKSPCRVPDCAVWMGKRRGKTPRVVYDCIKFK